MDDPSQIHTHSDRFQKWPSVTASEAYAAEVETSLTASLARDGTSESYLMAIEHADMHHETLMYNLNGCETLSRETLEQRRPTNAEAAPAQHPFNSFSQPPSSPISVMSQDRS